MKGTSELPNKWSVETNQASSLYLPFPELSS